MDSKWTPRCKPDSNKVALHIEGCNCKLLDHLAFPKRTVLSLPYLNVHRDVCVPCRLDTVNFLLQPRH